MTRRTARWAAPLLAATALAGCGTLGTLAGAVTGAASSAATGNPAIGIALGIGVKTATDATLKRYSRRVQRAEQERIAETAGEMGVGERREWASRGRLGFGGQRGEVRVERELANALGECKEIVFSVAPDDAAEPAPWFVAAVCRHTDGWRWASAEPATTRWVNLQ